MRSSPLSTDSKGSIDTCKEYHTVEVDGEKHGGMPYGGPQGFADMFRFNEPKESQVLKRQLIP